MKPGDNAKDDRALAAEAVRLAQSVLVDIVALLGELLAEREHNLAHVDDREQAARDATARAERAEVALAEAEAKRDKAAALAETYRRDWYDVKAEFQASCDNAVATARARVVEEIAALADERAAYHLDEAVADSAAAHSGAHKALSNLAETIRRRNGARVVVPLPTSIADGGRAR